MGATTRLRSLSTLFLLLVLAIARQYAFETDDDSSINTTKLSDVLDKLINSTTYDKRLRPNYGGKPVDVGITIHVSSISAVSEVDMDFTLDFYMRQKWVDPRLAFGEVDLGLPSKITTITVGIDYLEKLWKPDTFFPNEKRSFFHTATTHNSFLRITKDGEVLTSQRLTVTATCNMQLHLFPMDSQRCKLEIESYGYDTNDISYKLLGERGLDREKDIDLPQFNFTHMDSRNVLEKLESGTYSRLIMYFLFKRDMGFYLLQVYIPSMLITIISWVSFWLSRDATPARVALGVTTVLTETTLMTQANTSMPKVSYVKSIDIFLGVCFMLVFCALLEYAIVGYIGKRMKIIKKRKESKAAGLLSSAELPSGSPPADAPPPKRAISVPAYYNSVYRPFYSSKDRSSHLYLPETQQTPLLYKESVCSCPFAHQEEELVMLRATRTPKASLMAMKRGPMSLKARILDGIRPSTIDTYSRIFFPCVFIVFNAIYWSYFLNISNSDSGLAYDPELEKKNSS